MHFDEEQLQRLLHHQLAPSVGRMAREHLVECTECRERFVRAEREEAKVFALLRQVDHPPPAVDAETVAARARRSGFEWGRWAAAIFLVLGMAGAAYAIPGSPLPGWVRSVAALVGLTGYSPRVSRPSGPGEVQMAGMAALPGPEFVILFQRREPGGQAQVSLTDGGEVTVRAPVGAASFTSGADRLIIANAGTGTRYLIEIPRSAPRVEIRLPGRTIFLKTGDLIQAEGAAQLSGAYVVFLSP